MRDGKMCGELQGLLEKIYRERGFDFREYKETTLTRRLSRRLRARGAETYSDYARVLDQYPAEYDKLFSDLTINVSDFSRDEAAFKALEEEVLPGLISEYNRDTNTRECLRIWSAGCATGQEPYSIAMLLLEMLRPEVETRHAVSLQCNVTIRAPEVETRHAVSLRCNVTIRAPEVETRHAVSLQCNVAIRAPEVETRHAVSLRCNVAIRAPEVETRHAVSLRCNVTIRAPEVETRHAVSLRCNVTIRATDIDAKALQRAQEGVFAAKMPKVSGRYG